MKIARLGLIAAIAATCLVAMVPHLDAASSSLPPGTRIPVRMIDKLSSENAKVGDTFHGTLAEPVVVNGKTVLAKGSDVSGEVVKVERSGRLSSPGELHLVLRSVRSNFLRSSSLSVQPVVIKGGSHTKSNVTKIGGGTAAGAVIGGLAGGGKGAVIGAAVGAGTGTAVAAATGKREAVVPSEAILTWVVTGQPTPLIENPNSFHRGRGGNDYSGTNRHPVRDYDDGSGQDVYGGAPVEFGARERSIIRACFAGNNSGLPPGLAKRDRLPPGLERQLQRNGTLPPGLQKRVQPLPSACTVRLPRLPVDWARVILGARVILLDPGRRIIDLFLLDSND